jgi:biopolymer transport protein TolR
MVDVMLVLLIIMMLVAPMLQKGVDVRLPRRATPSTSRKRRTDGRGHHRRHGRFYVNGIQVRETTCAARVQEALEEKTERIVLIKADTDAPYSAVMAAMDRLREAQIEDIGLITERKRRRATEGRQLGHGTRNKHHGAEKVVKGKDMPAVPRRHERHAADRRAARAARHLHGRPAAHPEGRRHQPAARDPRAPRGHSPTVSQIVLEYTADRRISVNKQDVTMPTSRRG